MGRERIEEFVRRYWREVLAVAAAILLALLLTLRWLRVLRVLAVPVLIGAILVVGWLLLGPWLIIPPFAAESPVVRNGVAAVVVCGNKREGTLGLLEEGVISNIAPEAQTATWSIEERGRCEIYYQHPRNEE